MTGLASRAADGLDSRPDFRLGIALALACALHAAVIWGIDPPARGSAYDTQALDIRLIAGSAPAPSAEISPEPRQSSASSRAEPASALPDSGPRSLHESGLTSGAAATVVPKPGGFEGRQSNPGSRPSSATDQQTIGQTPLPDSGTGSPVGNNTFSYPELAREIANTHAVRTQAEALEPGGTRTKRLTGSSAKSIAEAAYLDMWRQKTERIGRANYPPGGITGELLLLAVIRQDGALEEVRVLESSGFAALDEAAMRTVRLAAPYSHFTTEMRKAYDRLEIVRRWRFEHQGAFLH